jgi:hypothetical protein
VSEYDIGGSPTVDMGGGILIRATPDAERCRKGGARKSSADALLPDDEIHIFVDSDAVLRKGWKGLAKAQHEFGAEAARKVGEFGQGPLEGAVSVELDLWVPEVGQQPQIPGAIKAYLDSLEGIAYHEDRQVAHLVVHRHALDHPLLGPGYKPDEPRRGASLSARLMPLERYTAAYDRAFQLTFWRGRDASPWFPRWGISDESRLVQARWRQKALGKGSDPSLDELVRSLEEERLRDGTLADLDRPGPLPATTRGMHLDHFHWRLRQRHGAVFLFDLRGQEPGTSEAWKADVEQAFRSFAQEHPGAPFNGWVALDIAVRGSSLHGKDLDNLAHSILIAFEQELCERRGTVVAYRAYEAAGHPPGVQVRVLDSGRILELQIKLSETRGKQTRTERLQAWLERHAQQARSRSRDHSQARTGRR